MAANMDGSGDNRVDIALRNYADRILKLDDEKAEINKDRREVFAEAKAAGFDVTTLREIVSELKMEPAARAARYQLLNEYREALGMLEDTPLGQAAIEAQQDNRRRGNRHAPDFDA